MMGFVVQAEDGIRGFGLSRGVGDVYKGQSMVRAAEAVEVEAAVEEAVEVEGAHPQTRSSSSSREEEAAVVLTTISRSCSTASTVNLSLIHI